MFPRLFPSPWLLIGASVACFFAPTTALAGGPKYVAGVSYFNSAVMGQPVIWPGGQVNYFVDQGPLRFVRNRAKRLGNFISNEFRNR